jgi:hypothetical protein
VLVLLISLLFAFLENKNKKFKLYVGNNANSPHNVAKRRLIFNDV